MSSVKATAIVLRVVEYSETSSVVTLFTREFGKVRALAKGARRPQGPFEAALDLLAGCRIAFLHKSSDALDLMTEAKLERRFRPAGGNLARLYAAYYVAELVSELTEDDDPHPELFDLAEATLVKLSDSRPPAYRLVLRFELIALKILGHLPSLVNCANCGVPVNGPKRSCFGLLASGLLCDSCRVGMKQLVQVSAEVIQTLRQFAKPTDPQWHDQDIRQPILGELRSIMNRYFEALLNRRLRLSKYLD